ncbi:hypothetical protein ASPWEDRAFT_175985 [Aspergillus wentii DTO 134E9]|uniref:Uncharacterized protein n=1 Tax=Aspergillus wentii DTO 134E9 TaxID=1073089 RepID=A0A1L9R7I3_ASPWE|nr:uncharacterized protein ASPWEDRAFT_175985 [Aspergillus wentii DTO 134E9]KAI9927505.1 hypothetical protein MW887_003121 [Aspergillus wentii]OJJ30880.1 hypothetical protein ASPWEDRAFT_175985 [Aspergillus wentii DTO 134E9]
MEPTPTLQTRLDQIQSFNLSASIKALAELTPNLTSSITPTGDRLISHFAYPGTANLDLLAKFFLKSGKNCARENASLETRLLHHSMDPIFYVLYCGTENAFRESGIEGNYSTELGGCCAHCSGEPAAVIPDQMADGEALFFEEEHYNRLWGDQESLGMRVSWPNGVRGETWLRASREQVEDAIARNAEGSAASQAML